jgi:hypothetical protein
MYTLKKMRSNLLKGDVGEAFFKHWCEQNIDVIKGVVAEQFGYNPKDVVNIKSKREILLSESFPDFAVFKRSDTKRKKPLLGISVNTQSKGYTIDSTMGGFCCECPRRKSCVAGTEQNLWYNQYNITNDYPSFKSKYGADVILVTLFITWRDAVFKFVKANHLEPVVKRYLVGGRKAVKDSEAGKKFLQRLIFTGNTSTPRPYDMRWLALVDIEQNPSKYQVTGGLSQYGRPRKVYCVDYDLTKGEVDLKTFIKSIAPK